MEDDLTSGRAGAGVWGAQLGTPVSVRGLRAGAEAGPGPVEHVGSHSVLQSPGKAPAAIRQLPGPGPRARDGGHDHRRSRGRLRQAGTGSQRPGHLGRGRPTQPFCRPSERGFRKGREVLHPTQSPGPGLRAPRELRASGDREGSWRHSLGSGEPRPSPDVWLSLPEAWELWWGLASAEPPYSAGARAGA